MARRNAQVRLERKNPALFILLCTAPAFLLTIWFVLIPTGRALLMSLTDSTSISMNYHFVGFENFRDMFKDRRFMQALNNTLRLMLVVPIITLTVSLVLASVISRARIAEKGFYRTVFFFPSIVSMTVVGIIWSFVFHPTMGILNTLLNNIGLGALAAPWLGDSSKALWAIAATLVWQAAGYYMVMHIAAMDGIAPEIYEAATIDGATGLRQFISITLPLIKDIIGITYVLSLSGTINLSYVLSSVMTGGGPNGSSTVLLQYMYKQGMGNANFGYAMAITVFTLGISIVLSGVSRWLSGRQERAV